ncbi:MAG: dihydrodipicolinate synthase family protein [Rhodospirillales bacterium]|nr:dihydrodipicolinate synthase family protein [Rhodospirillales bacterium]
MKGVNCAVLTPLNRDLSPDLGRMAAHCVWLLENGCDGLAILGTTGEATSFSVRERMTIMEGLASAGIPMDKTMPGCGAAAFTDSIEITRCAMDLGIGGVLMLPPFYYKDVTDDGLYNAYSEIIGRVNSSQLRVYLYHFPQMSATPISHDLIARLIKDFPDTVVGLKDSSGDEQNMLDMIRKFPGFAILPGSERVFANVLKAGGAGCITAISNVSSNLTQRVYSSWIERGEIDQQADDLLQAIRGVIGNYPLFASLKALMADHSGDISWETFRPPLCSLEQDARTKLITEFKATGYKLPPL